MKNYRRRKLSTFIKDRTSCFDCKCLLENNYLLAILRYNMSEFEAVNSLLYSLDVNSKLLRFKHANWVTKVAVF
jgi:hypothetical protein